MLVHEDGRFVGSVSGGCVEGDVLARAAAVIAGGRADRQSYGVSNAAAWEVGLPCGGSIEILIQPVGAAGFAPALFDRIAAARAAGEALWIETDPVSGVSIAGRSERPGRFRNLYAPPRRALIVGAVEIAMKLAPIALAVGVTPTIIDPRGAFLTEARFPGLTLDDRWPDEAIASARPDMRTAVILLSHDPKLDDPAIIAALAAPTRYIAALGSRASHAARLDRLAARGIAPETLARIEGPAGVPINAITAGEIALSIAGGMVRAFNEGLR